MSTLPGSGFGLAAAFTFIGVITGTIATQLVQNGNPANVAVGVVFGAISAGCLGIAAYLQKLGYTYRKVAT